MTPLALTLVLLAAACHAAWNFVAKRAGGDNHFVLLGALMVVVLWAPVVLWFGLDGVSRWGTAEWGVLSGSAIVHILYFRTLLHGYAVSDLSVVYPVARGSGPLLASIGTVIVLGESLSMVSGAGALAVVCGVFLIAGGPALWRKARDPLQRAQAHRGIAWGALTGMFIAGYTVADGYAVKVLLLSPLVVDYVGNLLRVPVMLPFALRDPPGFIAACRRGWQAALVIATLGPLGYMMVLYAVQMAPLSHVAPAREVSMLFAALLGGTLLGETDRRLRLLGAACIAGGVIALSLG